MTIGWGFIGTIWRMNMLICFVRPSRHTYQFMENQSYFTVSFYDAPYKEAMSILGSQSGRKVDKVKNAGFNPMPIGESVTFKEAYMTILCKKAYQQPLDEKHFPKLVKEIYYANNDVHEMYFGEIVEIYENH